MSRSSWKFLPFLEKDCYLHLNYLLKKNYYNLFFNQRKVSINFLNYPYSRKVYQGKFFIYIIPTVFHIGYKVGQFTKTRKPFFFRTKKNKIK